MRQKYINLYFFLICTIIIHTFASAQVFEVNATVDKSSIYIGDEITYTLTLTYSEDIQIEKPGPGANLGSFEIKEYNLSPLMKKNNIISETMTYVIVIFELGEFTIPSLTIAGQIKNKWVKIKSDEIRILVNEITPQQALTNDIIDIKEQISSKEIEKDISRFSLTTIIIISILLLIIIILLILFLRKKQKEKEIIPYYDETLLLILDLLKKKYFKNEKYREFYYEFSHIIKHYLEARYLVPCTILMTGEIEREFSNKNIEQSEFYIEFLKYSDKVKFAKYKPEKEKTSFFVRNMVAIIQAEKKEKKEKEENEENEPKNKNLKKLKISSVQDIKIDNYI